MDILGRANKAIQQAEAELRRLVSEAATSGDYASVVQITSWAKSINELLTTSTTRTSSVRVKLSSPPKPGSVREKAATPKHQSSPATRRKEYPIFFRRGDQLVRISWSKREKKEYQHKASLSVVEVLVAAMMTAGKDGRIFSTDEILPIQDATDSSNVPNYQAYVGIAFLKQASLIDQHGRQGYSIPRLSEFQKAVDLAWRKLPEQKP